MTTDTGNSLSTAAHSEVPRRPGRSFRLGVAASVISGLLIAYLRPGAAIIPEGGREFTTSNPALNFALEGHAFISVALEWLCGFHAVYSLWGWLIKKTQWRSIVGVGLERTLSVIGRLGSSHLGQNKFRF